MKFLIEGRPTIVGMVKTAIPEKIITEIKTLIDGGADAIGLQLETISKTNKTRERLAEYFAAAQGKPIYVTNYRRFNVQEPLPTDEELAEELVEAAMIGASLIDVRGDMFHPEDDEFTEDNEAVEKQKKLIKRIQDLGAEVLISTHIFHYTPKDEVIRIAEAMRERGADIAKVVAWAENEQQLSEAFDITRKLKEELTIPALFLVNGDLCRRHRYEAPVIEKSMFLVVDDSRANETQPTVSEAINIIKA